MHSIQIDKTKFEIPQNWAELSHKQVRKLLPYFLNSSGKIRRGEVFAALFPERVKLLRLLDDGQLDALLQCFAWVDAPPLHAIIPEIKIRGTTYIAPPPRFEQFAAEEFVRCLQILHDADQHPERFLELAAYIYRPKISHYRTSDKRAKFTQSSYDKRLPLFQKQASQELILSAVIYFAANKKQFSEDYREAFPESKTQAKSGQVAAWVSTLHNVADEGVFGTFEQTQKESIRTIGFHLVKRKREYDDQKRNLRRN